MKKNILLLGFFIIVFSSAFSEEVCINSPCIVSKDEGVLSGFLIAPNLDINFLISTIHLGQATHDFDLNFSLRSPDGNFLQKDVAAIQADKNGLWYFQIVGGLSQEGDYLIIWDAQHLIGGVADGNHDTETWQITVLPAPVTTGTGSCEINLQTSFYLGQYLQITYSGFDVNGSALSTASFDLFRGNNLLIDNQSLNQIGNSFTFVSDKKTNDDPYNLIVTSGECVTTKIVQTNSK